jgi:hypothetical protein
MNLRTTTAGTLAKPRGQRDSIFVPTGQRPDCRERISDPVVIETMPARQWRRAKHAEFARDLRRALCKKFPIYRSTKSAVLMPRRSPAAPSSKPASLTNDFKGLKYAFPDLPPPRARRIPKFDIRRHCRAATPLRQYRNARRNTARRPVRGNPYAYPGFSFHWWARPVFEQHCRRENFPGAGRNEDGAYDYWRKPGAKGLLNLEPE